MNTTEKSKIVTPLTKGRMIDIRKVNNIEKGGKGEGGGEGRDEARGKGRWKERGGGVLGENLTENNEEVK
jgi:hypothetical protein